MQDIITFEVNDMLYKGKLLVPFQIDETSQNRQLVGLAEKYFNGWMRQIRTAIFKGKEIRHDPPTVGPRNELEFWRYTLSLHTSIAEFTATKPFLNHLECMKLSHSKLAYVSKRIIF